MKANWNYPTTIWVGENRCKDLNTACENLHIINPLFVTDKDLINLPMVKSIILHLKLIEFLLHSKKEKKT